MLHDQTVLFTATPDTSSASMRRKLVDSKWHMICRVDDTVSCTLPRLMEARKLNDHVDGEAGLKPPKEGVSGHAVRESCN